MLILYGMPSMPAKRILQLPISLKILMYFAYLCHLTGKIVRRLCAQQIYYIICICTQDRGVFHVINVTAIVRPLRTYIECTKECPVCTHNSRV